MNIKALVDTVGLSKDTIRFYEREGLISPPARLSNGYRDYDNKNVEQLNMIILAKNLGFTLSEIKELTQLLYANNLSQANMGKKLVEKSQQIDKKIAELLNMKAAIDEALKGMCTYKEKLSVS
ncbi:MULTISPECIES: MerR family transcriptional regulator [unclassified Psychrobacter]|uniref:MerR family transcriptional regulator n=1 Tax=unclassified Psychrobacter TaxID=196806 RepID=UPI0018F7881F|nr:MULTISPECIES: MerR family transcriptional regulator [unclassified Psychrobacter]